jgi:UDP-4-amino-4,6-dideoxy-N-acetyl-beta-L-altrosamine N-acetyltransferase
MITSTIDIPANSPTLLRQSYQISDTVSMTNFIDLTETEALDVLRWRNHPQVRDCMYKKDIITKEQHLNFIASLPQQDKRFYWVLKENGKSMGVIDIVDYHLEGSEWGFYLNPDFFGKGKSPSLLFHGLNFLFKTLQFQNLYGYCHYKNIKGLLFHDLFHIYHQGYKKIEVGEGVFDWYSHRVITAADWTNQQATLPLIVQRIKNNKKRNQMKTQEILEEQMLLEKMSN